MPRTSAIKSVADLKGKKIGLISLATGAISVVKAMLHLGGPERRRLLKLLPVGISGAQALAALKSRSRASAVVVPCSHTAIENHLGVKLSLFHAESGVQRARCEHEPARENAMPSFAPCKALIMSTVYIETNPAAGCARLLEPVRQAEQQRGERVCEPQ